MSGNGSASPIAVDAPAASADAPAVESSASGSLFKLDFFVGQKVVVRLNSGVDYRGVLSCLDGYMNIALEQTEEYVNGILTNSYGDAFVRGNNGQFILTARGILLILCTRRSTVYFKSRIIESTI